MIGFYNYSVILTYISLAFSVFGMTQAIEGRFRIAITCLALSGLCDMFDGKIARAMKSRTQDAKAFGIQIDSLCDIVCFGAFPAMICYLLGVRGIVGITILVLYCTASVIRLGYFNVMEMKGAQMTENGKKYYHGLPITSMAVALPLVFLIQPYVTDIMFLMCVKLVVFIVGLLFIVDFRFRKPKNATLAVLVGVVAVALVFMLGFSRMPVPFPVFWFRR